ncbi:MAG: AraC family transcriptional regulator [Lachnospira sp.]|nr:AraC family transcriptional regulator [Lachnospira sp.]
MLTDMPNDFKIEKIKRAANFKMPTSHVHPFYDVTYLISGECTCFVNHNIYKLSKGDLIIIPPGEIHRSTFHGNMQSERFVLSFRDDQLGWIRSLIGEKLVAESLKTDVISIPSKRRDYVESLLNKLLFESDDPDILSPAFIQAGLLELLLFVIRCQQYENNVLKEIDVDNQLMQEIATYVYNNYDKKISLDDMAQRFHISRSYLSKKFKTATGFGFKEYLNMVRIEESKRLLSNTDYSLIDIAIATGFENQSYFSRIFKKYTGLTPKQFR